MFRRVIRYGSQSKPDRNQILLARLGTRLISPESITHNRPKI